MISAAIRIRSRAKRATSFCFSLTLRLPYWAFSCWAPSVSLAFVVHVL